jgi:hypothetical protein
MAPMINQASPVDLPRTLSSSSSVAGKKRRGGRLLSLRHQACLFGDNGLIRTHAPMPSGSFDLLFLQPLLGLLSDRAERVGAKALRLEQAQERPCHLKNPRLDNRISSSLSWVSRRR